MQRTLISKRYFSVPDIVVLFLLATAIYGVFSIAHEWRAEFHPVTEIDLSVTALPYYAFLSAMRGLVAFTISLGFTLVVGYTAAKSQAAEKIIIPLIDILQSIPVLGFLPGLLLGLVALFPERNFGLELAAIIMIFTGQVWNMTLGYYTSLKSIPGEFKEASDVMGLNWRQRLVRLELPYSAVNLAWNSLLSMAGGWFFLITCEAFTLGENQYRLPGIGAYMDVAIQQNDTPAIVLALIAMVFLIVSMDFVIWRPLLSWVQKFRLEEGSGSSLSEPLMQIWFRESQLVQWLTQVVREKRWSQKLHLKYYKAQVIRKFEKGRSWNHLSRALAQSSFFEKARALRLLRLFQILILTLILGVLLFGAFRLFVILSKIPVGHWVILLRNTLWTLVRVFFALLISTLWAVPVGIWIGTSPRRIRIAQPIIQVMASFPAPMLYPLVLGVLFALHVSFDVGSMLLILLGVQWYVLFNVLAGAMKIPTELNYALSLMETSVWDRWSKLYLPSIFPSLVTGWITAAGGAWNASVLAEYTSFGGEILKTAGLGSTLSVSLVNKNYTLFAASLTLMVFVVIVINRFVWLRVLRLAETRFRMDS